MCKGSLKVISEGTIKFSSPDEFNDPFDCAPDYDVKKNIEYISRRPDLLKTAGKKLGLSPAKRLQHKKVMLRNIERATSEDNYGANISKQSGICCLSKAPLNLLMWAHYAKDHTGFVVEFRIPQNVKCTKGEAYEYLLKYLYPLEVVYSEDKPVIDPSDNDVINTKKQYLTKSKDWEYEQEERVVDNMRGSGIHPYEHKIILKSVIAGLKMKDTDYTSLKSTIHKINSEMEINVKLYKAEKLKGKFALFVPGRDDLSDCSN